VLIDGIVEHWPAYSKWSFDHFIRIAGYRTVPCEIGSKYTEESWSQELMQLHQFYSRFMNKSTGVIGYLAQHRLFMQIPLLVKDIIIPDYCALTGSDDQDVDLNIWFGPAGTVSPLHTDPRDNLLCQVIGRKFVRLISPNSAAAVYAIEDGILTNTSQVDAEHPDLDRFPLFAQAECRDCVLLPGQMLFIPRGWWHYVRSMDPSISVSCWFG